ncbi:MAG: OmpA family protein [Cytophagales bacterium]
MIFRTLQIFFVLLTLSYNSLCQNWSEVLRISAIDTQNDLQFGYSVDIDGNYAVVGANGIEGGSAYVFEKQNNGTWKQIHKLKGTDTKDLDQFGGSVSIDGDIIVVGAAWSDIKKGEYTYKDAGSVYVFKRDGNEWKEIKKLQANDPFNEDQFGISVDVDGNTILVGAIWNDLDENGKKRRQDAGAAYIFENQNGNWAQKQKLVHKDRKPFDLFGVSVSIDGDLALIGAYRQGFNSNNKDYIEFAGAAYVFNKNAEGIWEEKQKLTAKNRTEGSFFGYSVSLKNQLALIGAQEHKLDVHGGSSLRGSGAAYIFKNNGTEWEQSQKLTPLDRQKDAFFGESVYTDGSKCIIGAWGQQLDGKGQNALDTAGAMYIFEDSGNGNWVEKDKLTPGKRRIGDQFGISVAIDGEYAIGGAWGYDLIEKNTEISWGGAAFIFAKCRKPDLKISASHEFIKYGDDVILSASGADYFEWSSEVKNNISFRPTKTNKYKVKGRNSDGCYAEAEIEIFVRQAELEQVSMKKVQVNNVKPGTVNDFRIIQLGNNRSLAASTEEIVQKFKGLTVLSNLKFNGTNEPAANVKVLLLDENGMVLKRGKTNSAGQAKFEMLDPDLTYNVVIDKNDPQLESLVQKSGKEIALRKKEFIDKVSGYALLSHIEFKESSEPASEIYVLLLDENGYVLKKGKTNSEGIAFFEELEKGKSYRVIIDKNHPSLNVDVKLNGKVVTIDTKRILENFEQLTVLSRLAYTNSEDPAADVPVMLVDENGVVLKKGITNSEGIAMFVVPDDNRKYTVMIDEGMLGGDLNEEGKGSKFDNIYFDFNSDVIRKEAIGILQKMAEVLKQEKDKKVVVRAHTDALGSDEINDHLARRRGESVKRYLMSQGIEASRIQVDPVGDDQPIASNDKDIGRQLNRRVEFEFLN